MKREESTPAAILALAQGVRELQQQGPVVDEILLTGSRDVPHIEQTLDGLLDFCDHEPVLALYKQLCCHYWVIAPAATSDYVRAYQERWNGDE